MKAAELEYQTSRRKTNQKDEHMDETETYQSALCGGKAKLQYEARETLQDKREKEKALQE